MVASIIQIQSIHNSLMNQILICDLQIRKVAVNILNTVEVRRKGVLSSLGLQSLTVKKNYEMLLCVKYSINTLQKTGCPTTQHILYHGFS
jgi:hypothetical protein